MGKKQSKLTAEELAELTQLTYFTAKELNQWYRGFMRDCPSGTILEQEFCTIYRQYFPFGNSDHLASQIFKAFHPERDGTIGFKQFVVNFSIVLRGNTDEKLKWIFNILDRDQDGYVNKDDLTYAVECMYKMTGHMVDLPANSLQNRVTDILTKMSNDGTERISLENFMVKAKQDSMIMQSLTVHNH